MANKKITNQFLSSRMMLMEQREKLKELYQKEKTPSKRLAASQDEQEQERIQSFLEISLRQKQTIEIEYYFQGKPKKIKGVMIKKNSLANKIRLVTKEGNVTTIIVKNIISIEA